jgi:hypothetical protein
MQHHQSLARRRQIRMLVPCGRTVEESWRRAVVLRREVGIREVTLASQIGRGTTATVILPAA